ncbi:hypothetical protein PFICI_10860 [Pestalotiopsis fici W106-1]|uniref:Uncharacterized protein n=1 Tax=Pestalotiopsis fici (strain W106-1 / CGMCC3.15140) TaxID=1229662 RepID=W3WVV4_PESFW|nr:uncharacterized protein PFICI_10860 [Pestalotiopsis fici W106-1]ETS76986.1 hypothetical protein PFICI_10860 [Pestalotiopsis fici W106-1]
MESLDRARDESMDDVFLQDDLSQTIAEHATRCQSLFHKYMVRPEIVPDPTIMDDQLARFSLWASNMDVYGPLNVSLDYRLRFSPTAAEIIHQLLDIICDTLTSLKPIDHRPPPQTTSRKRQRISAHGDSEVMRRGDDDASDSDSDVDSAEGNILKITETIGGTLTRLFRLSNAVRKSAKANRARKIERYQGDKESNDAIAELRIYTECYIRFRFPEAPDALRLALVEANALRLRRLHYQRSHRRRIELSIQTPQSTPAVVQLPKMTPAAPTVRFAPGPAVPKSTTTSKMLRPAPVPATNATTARQTAVQAFYAKSTTEVPRAKSALVNNNLSFPPMPPTKQCPYCGVIVEFNNTKRPLLWQNHVIGDLEPFICVFSQCLVESQNGTSPLTFETSKAWSSHMQTAHGHTWECRAPSHDPMVFDQETHYQEHSIQEHGVPEAYARTLSSAARRRTHEKILECPFGDDFQSSENTEYSTVFSSDALQVHVAAHMKEIALLTLQKLPGDGDEDTDDFKSDQVDDDGPGLGITRDSMDSLLGDEDLDFSDDATMASDSSMSHDDEGSSEMTKLHFAVHDGNLPLVESLVREGASLSNRDSAGRTALHVAVMKKSHDQAIMDLLLSAGGKDLVNLGDENRQTALHYAAERGLIETINILVSHGADTGTTDNFGFSPFLWAVVAGQVGVTEKLLILGANVNSFSADGKSALAWAAGLGYDGMTLLLLGHGFSARTSQIQSVSLLPLGEASAFGNHIIVRAILDSGANPNDRDRDGWSAIHWAAEEGHLNIVGLLLNKGANVNAVSSYGTSPLHCAANGGHDSIVNLLLQSGADPLKSTCHGWTALHHAAFMGHSRVVQSLLQYDGIRSSASQQDNHGWSALHLAIHSRDTDTIHLLLDRSIIAEPQTLFDESGLTAEEWLDFGPISRSQKARATGNLAFSKSRCCRAVTGLRRAVTNGTGNIPMIKLFLTLGHDINGTDSGRRTALYYAVKRRMLPVIDLLLSMDADPNILPVGRRTWEEFISDAEVLLRLNRAGYQTQDADPEIEHQIRLAFGPHRRPSMPDPSVSFESEEPLSRTSTQLPIRSVSFPSVTPSSTPPLPGHSASNTPTLSPASAQQTNDNKRKASSGSWWRRAFRTSSK